MNTTTPFPYVRLLQMLSTFMVEIRALQTLVSPADATTATTAVDLVALRAGLQDLQEQVSETLSTLRIDFAECVPSELTTVRLNDLLSNMVEETAERMGIASRLAFSGSDELALEARLSAPARRLLYLATREALYQVERHSQAHRIRFSLNYGQDRVQLSLEDDGLPEPYPLQNSATRQAEDPEGSVDAEGPGALDALSISPPVPPLSFFTTPSADPIVTFGQPALDYPIGNAFVLLDDLRQRVEQLGGSLEIHSSENGTRVQLQLPYTHPDTALDATTVATIDEPASIIPSTTSISSTTDTSATQSNELVRVLIVDGQAVTRAGLHRLLESYPGLVVIGEAADSLQAVSETIELGPQVVLLDAQLVEGQSLEVVRQIKQLNLNTRVLVLAIQDREEYLYEALRAGADGYVLKDIAPDDLALAVRAVARGEVLIQPQIAGRLLSNYGRRGRRGAGYDTLTTRELEVLRLLARGLRNKEIASRLSVSERTVNFHLANIYQKLQVSGRTEALRKALEQGLVTTS